jgi:3-oxoacyl-[acyl-carrier protein] reductase
MQLLKTKKTLITGGTSGIGKEIAITFAKQGADVAIFGTHAQRASQVVQELEQIKVFPQQQFASFVIDVSDKLLVENAIQQLLAKWEQIDVLVNNAGITRDGLLMRMTEEDWDRVIDVNLKSVYNMCQALVRSMIKAKKGKIINISSVVGLIGNPGQVNYAASKSGMIGFTKALALELASRGVCVNCITPGFIQTPMTDSLTDGQKEEILKKIPLGHMGSPQDVANAVVYFASDSSNYITGQVLSVDGGMVR